MPVRQEGHDDRDLMVNKLLVTATTAASAPRPGCTVRPSWSRASSTLRRATGSASPTPCGPTIMLAPSMWGDIHIYSVGALPARRMIDGLIELGWRVVCYAVTAK